MKTKIWIGIIILALAGILISGFTTGWIFSVMDSVAVTIENNKKIRAEKDKEEAENNALIAAARKRELEDKQAIERIKTEAQARIQKENEQRWEDEHSISAINVTAMFKSNEIKAKDDLRRDGPWLISGLVLAITESNDKSMDLVGMGIQGYKIVVVGIPKSANKDIIYSARVNTLWQSPPARYFDNTDDCIIFKYAPPIAPSN